MGQIIRYDFFSNKTEKFYDFGDSYSRKFEFNQKLKDFVVFGLDNG